jgi:pimeloyl-ACP methyl ester carboxylesterase
VTINGENGLRSPSLVWLVVIPGASHVAMVESPDALADAIRLFREEGFDEARDSDGM